MHWFKTRVEFEEVPDHIKWLSMGPTYVAKRYAGYFVNGYRFHTRERDERCKTQNSGVTLTALTPSFASSRDPNPILGDVTYYGAIQEIIEIDYWAKFSIVLFRCDWFQVERDDYGLPRVNFNKLCYLDDPFVMATQVHQVFYVEDPLEEGWHYVMSRLPRDLFDIEEEIGANISDSYWAEPRESRKDFSGTVGNDDEISWCREDVPGTTLDVLMDIA